MEAQGLLDGKLPAGNEFPVFSFEGFRNRTVGPAAALRGRPGFRNGEGAPTAATRPSTQLRDDPLLIVRAGGAEAAATYLDRAEDRRTSEVTGSWHCLHDIDPDQPQARVLFLGGDEGGATTEYRRTPSDRERGYIGIWGTHYRMPIEAEYGIRGDTSMINVARYVAVAPQGGSRRACAYLPLGA